MTQNEAIAPFRFLPEYVRDQDGQMCPVCSFPMPVRMRHAGIPRCGACGSTFEINEDVIRGERDGEDQVWHDVELDLGPVVFPDENVNETLGIRVLTHLASPDQAGSTVERAMRLGATIASSALVRRLLETEIRFINGLVLVVWTVELADGVDSINVADPNHLPRVILGLEAPRVP